MVISMTPSQLRRKLLINLFCTLVAAFFCYLLYREVVASTLQLETDLSSTAIFYLTVIIALTLKVVFTSPSPQTEVTCCNQDCNQGRDCPLQRTNRD